MATQTGRPRRAWPHLASRPRPAASAPPPSRPAPAGPCSPVRGRHGVRDPRLQAPAHACPARTVRAPRPPLRPLRPAHLQGADEEVPEGLHGAKRVLQGQLLGILAQVVGQLQLLLLDGLEHLLQGLGRLDAGLGVTAWRSRPGDGVWELWPRDRGRPLARGAPGGRTAEPPAAGPLLRLAPPPRSGLVDPGLADARRWVGGCSLGTTHGTPTCRRWAYCCCTSGVDDTFRSISRSFFRLVLASEWIISRLTLKGTAGQAGSADS